MSVLDADHFAALSFLEVYTRDGRYFAVVDTPAIRSLLDAIIDEAITCRTVDLPCVVGVTQRHRTQDIMGYSPSRPASRVANVAFNVGLGRVQKAAEKAEEKREERPWEP